MSLEEEEGGEGAVHWADPTFRCFSFSLGCRRGGLRSPDHPNVLFGEVSPEVPKIRSLDNDFSTTLQVYVFGQMHVQIKTDIVAMFILPSSALAC